MRTSRPALASEDSSAGGGSDREGGPLHNSIDRIDSGGVHVDVIIIESSSSSSSS